MADILQSLFGQIVQKFKDMGDGTYAKVVATVSSNAGASADQVQGNVAAGTADAGNPVKIGGKYNATLPTYADGQRGDLQLSARGSARALMQVNGVSASDNFFNNSVGFVGNDASPTNGVLLMVGDYAFNGTGWDRVVKPNSAARLLSSAASTNGASIKASAGNVQKIVCNNTNAADRFLKLYNKASAPIVGTDTPILTLTLPASTKNIQIDMGATGQYFGTGIAYAITANAADADATAIAAGDITALNITYS